MDIWPYIKTNLRLIWVEFWKSMEKKKFLMGIDPGSPLSLSRLPHSLIWCLNPLGHHWTGYKMIRKVRFCSAKIYFGLDIYKKSVYKKFTIPEVQEKESKFEEFIYKDKSWRLESACALPNIRIIQQLLLLFTNFIPISYSLKMERTFGKKVCHSTGNYINFQKSTQNSLKIYSESTKPFPSSHFENSTQISSRLYLKWALKSTMITANLVSL